MKYRVVTSDGNEVTEGSYFVLRLDTDLEAMKTALYYAGRISSQMFPQSRPKMSIIVWNMAREKSYAVLKRLNETLPYSVAGKTSGAPLDPEAVYFVLRMDNDKDQLDAVAYYASLISDINPRLSKDLQLVVDHGGDYERAGLSLKPSWMEQELGYDPEKV